MSKLQVRARQHFGKQLAPAEAAFCKCYRIADAIAQTDLFARRQRMVRRHQGDKPLLQAHQRLKVRQKRRAENQHEIDLNAASEAIARS